jgi:hypothetical protein
MDGNLSQKTAQKAGAWDAGIFVKYRKECTTAVEKEGGNFTLPEGNRASFMLRFQPRRGFPASQAPYMTAAFL